MWWSKPSAISTTPMTKRNASASIFTVGCAETKRPIGPTNSIISATDATTAATMTASTLTMPTAVTIESSENTTSMTMICRITAENVARAADDAPPFSPSSSWWISAVLFHSRNNPPAIRIRSRPEISCPKSGRVNRGWVSLAIQASSASSPMRMNIARKRPSFLARSRLAGSSLSTRMEMKITLSMPSTSSSTVSVTNAIQACGSASSSTLRARSDDFRGPRNLAHLAALVVAHRLDDLGLRVHHERAVARHRLLDRHAGEEQQPPGPFGAAKAHRVARAEHRELAILDLLAFVPDEHRAFEHENHGLLFLRQRD